MPRSKKKPVDLYHHVDPTMQDGHVLVGPYRDGYQRSLTMAPDTFTLVSFGHWTAVYDYTRDIQEGLHRLPTVLFNPEAAEETRRAVEVLEPAEVSEWCFMPGCLQPVTSTERGFSACAAHDADLREIDDLIAS